LCPAQSNHAVHFFLLAKNIAQTRDVANPCGIFLCPFGESNVVRFVSDGSQCPFPPGTKADPPAKGAGASRPSTKMLAKPAQGHPLPCQCLLATGSASPKPRLRCSWIIVAWIDPCVPQGHAPLTFLPLTPFHTESVPQERRCPGAVAEGARPKPREPERKATAKAPVVAGLAKTAAEIGITGVHFSFTVTKINHYDISSHMRFGLCNRAILMWHNQHRGQH